VKVTLEFTVPDEAEELRQAQNGPRYRAAIAATLQDIRGTLKHGSPEPAVSNALELVRAMLRGELEGLGEEF
jgi:hypothetical protein